VKVEYSSPQGDIFVEADRTRLIQVVSNLLNNALKFTDYGTVSVRLQSNQDEATVSISDTGHGIDPQILSRLFTKFTSKSVLGVGLGYSRGTWGLNLEQK